MSQQTNWVPTSVDLEKPSAARVYDYMLGGNHNFAVDREWVKQLDEADPTARTHAIKNRAFMRRVVLYLMEQGIRQFLDLGSGIPTVGNVHEIAQRADPSARVVYVELEHVAVAHAQLLLEGNDNAEMVHADITTPNVVLNDPAVRALLDFDQPIGVLAVTIGHYILDNPEGVFAAYRDAVVPGSYLGLSHITSDHIDMSLVTSAMARTQNAVRTRSKDEIARLFGDWELVEPGLVTTSRWRPDRLDSTEGGDALWVGVARKR